MSLNNTEKSTKRWKLVKENHQQLVEGREKLLKQIDELQKKFLDAKASEKEAFDQMKSLENQLISSQQMISQLFNWKEKCHLLENNQVQSNISEQEKDKIIADLKDEIEVLKKGNQTLVDQIECIHSRYSIQMSEMEDRFKQSEARKKQEIDEFVIEYEQKIQVVQKEMTLTKRNLQSKNDEIVYLVKETEFLKNQLNLANETKKHSFNSGNSTEELKKISSFEENNLNNIGNPNKMPVKELLKKADNNRPTQIYNDFSKDKNNISLSALSSDKKSFFNSGLILKRRRQNKDANQKNKASLERKTKDGADEETSNIDDSDSANSNNETPAKPKVVKKRMLYSRSSMDVDFELSNDVD